eukprot:470577_1
MLMSVNNNNILIRTSKALQIIQKWTKCTDLYTNMEYVKSFKNLDVSPNQLPNDKITVNTINAMMTAYINNKQYHSAVSLYKQYHSSHNQITHPVKILTKLIDFYGESKDINSSENVFKLIPKQKRTVSCITALLKVYSNNMYFDKVILLYKEYYSMHTEIMDNLVLKACQKVYNYKF